MEIPIIIIITILIAIGVCLKITRVERVKSNLRKGYGVNHSLPLIYDVKTGREIKNEDFFVKEHEQPNSYMQNLEAERNQTKRLNLLNSLDGVDLVIANAAIFVDGPDKIRLCFGESCIFDTITLIVYPRDKNFAKFVRDGSKGEIRGVLKLNRLATSFTDDWGTHIAPPCYFMNNAEVKVYRKQYHIREGYIY